MKNTTSMIEDILSKCKDGEVRIGDEKYGYMNYYAKFYTIIEGHKTCEDIDDNVPIMYIPNMSLFVQKIEKYLNEASVFFQDDQKYFCLENVEFNKKLLMDLIVNVTYNDMNNILDYIDKKTKMIVANKSYVMSKSIKWKGIDCIQSVTKNHSNLEGPYKFNIEFLDSNGEIFVMPSITFGLINNDAYVYAVQGKKSKQCNSLVKKLDRYFRKVNKSVDMDSCIGNVSPNALVSFTLFLSYIRTLGVTKMVAPDYLPLRYESNKISGYNKSKGQEDEFVQTHDRNQYNMTNKLMYLFERYNFHFDRCEASFDDISGTMTMDLDSSHRGDDNIIYELDDIGSNGESTYDD